MIKQPRGKTSKNLRDGLIHSNSDIDKILSVLGSVVTEEPEYWSDDEKDFDICYGFPESKEGVSLAVCNDDTSLGHIIGAYVYNGHLILIARYDGVEYRYSLTHPRGEQPDGTWINNIDIEAITVMGALTDFDVRGA